MLPTLNRLQLFQACSTIVRSISTTPARFISENKDDDDDEPIVLQKNPYEKPKPKCILCEKKIELNYKNTRLLQQFVSTFSGRVYERHVTGLCNKQHKRLLETIALSRRSGFMPIFVKDPKYLNDPKLFDPLKPLTPHSYA